MENVILEPEHPKISIEKHEEEIADTQDFTQILFDDIVAKVNQLKKDIEI